MNYPATRCLLVCFVLLIGPALAQEESAPPWLRIDASLYPYLDRVERDTDLTLTTNARLPARFSYFSYINFAGVTHDGDAAFNRSEQTLRWAVSEMMPFDLTAQALILDGGGNDLFQVGVGWRLNDIAFMQNFFDRLNLRYRMSFYLKRFSSGDNKVWQMEHFFLMRFPGISKRLYLSGFVDQTFNLKLPDTFPDSPVVTEVQLGMRLFQRFYGVAEYRVNQYRVGDEHNFAVGVEYKFRW